MVDTKMNTLVECKHKRTNKYKEAKMERIFTKKRRKGIM